MIERGLRGLARATTRAPRRTWALLAAVTLVAAALLPRFRIDPDVASLLPADHPAVELARELGSGTSRALFLTVRGEGVEQDLARLVESLERSPFLERVDATADALFAGRREAFERAPAWHLSERQLDALGERLTGEGLVAAVAESRDLLVEDPLAGSEIVQRDPLGVRWILDEGPGLPEGFAEDTPYLLLDGRRLALVRLVGKEDPFDAAFSRALVADVEERVRDLGLGEPELIGGYAAAATDSARMKHDLASSLWTSIPLILAFLVVSTRSFVRAHVVLLPVALAVVWALGFGGALLGPLTPLAISSAAILIGLGVDFAIHATGRLDEELAVAPRPEAVERAHVGTGRAILAGMATTVAAFLSFCFGSFPGLLGFGVLLALGLVASFATTMTLVPSLPGIGRASRVAVGPVVRAAGAVSASRAGRPVAVGLLLLALAGWIASAAGGLRFDADSSFLRPAAANRAANELTRSLGFSPLPVTVLVPGEREPDALAEGIERLRDAGELRFATGAHAAPLGETRGARVEAFRARTAGWVEGALDEFEAAGFRPEGLRPILEEQAERFAADPNDATATHRLEWRGESWWRDSLYAGGALADAGRRAEFHAGLAAELPEGAVVVDPYGLADELKPLLAADLRQALALCAVLVVVLVLAWIRAPGAALLALLPVFAGLGVALGALALLGVPLHPGNFVAIPLILGLGVDDGIHVVLRSREPGATREALARTGQAIWRTSVTTALGFGSLVTAQSPALASLGGIALLGVLVCFATSVLVLPPLLRTSD